MDKETAELIGYIVGGVVLFFSWRLLRPKKKYDGIFANRLKNIKKEREQDKDSVHL